MKAFKKICVMAVLSCAAVAALFAEKSNDGLKAILNEIVERENSGVLVENGGRGNVIEDGTCSYITDGKNLILVKTGKTPYVYTKVAASGNDGGVLYVTYGASEDETDLAFSSMKNDVASASGAGSVFSESVLSDFRSQLSSDSIRVDYRTEALIGGEKFDVLFTCLDASEPVAYEGLDPVSADYSEDEEDIDSTEDASDADDGKNDGVEGDSDDEGTVSPAKNLPPTLDQLRELLSHIVELESSGAISSSDCIGRLSDGFAYLSDGKNHFVINPEWDIPYEYDLLTSTVEGIPSVLYVMYGHDDEEDHLNFMTHMYGLVDYEDDSFFDLDYEDAWNSINSYTITYRDKVVINGAEYEVRFTDIHDDINFTPSGKESDAADDVPPTKEELAALCEYMVNLENSGAIRNTEGSVEVTDDYAYISNGDCLYMLNPAYSIPFECDRVISDVEGIPNIMMILYGHESDRFFLNFQKQCLEEYEVEDDFFTVDVREVYKLLTEEYTITYRTVAEINGVEYEIFCTDMNDDIEDDEDDEEEDDYFEDWEERVDDGWKDEEDEPSDSEKSKSDVPVEDEDVVDDVIPPLDRAGLDSIVSELVAEMNSRKYPSLFKTDKPYVRVEDAGRYIIRTYGFTFHQNLNGRYLYMAQLYTVDMQEGVMLLMFAPNDNMEVNRFLTMEFPDEETLEDMHMKGELTVTDEVLASVEDEIASSGSFVDERFVVIEGVKYHMYTIPFSPDMWAGDNGSSEK